MERKTLTEWPTELPEGRWEYVIKHMGDYDWTGHFAKDNGEIVFHDIDGGVWGPDSFTRGESFRPVDDDYVAPVRDVAAEAVLDAGPDPRDARIAALEGENAALKGRLRETCQILVESVGGLGPCDAEDAARRAAEVVDQFRARIAAPLRLGRGPTVEEAKAHADAQEDGHGWWLVSFDVRRHPDDEAIYFEIASIEVEDGEVFVDGMSSADGSRYTEITDAIPLSASRQPCGVGVKS